MNRDSLSLFRSFTDMKKTTTCPSDCNGGGGTRRATASVQFVQFTQIELDALAGDFNIFRDRVHDELFDNLYRQFFNRQPPTIT